jgi:3-oxoacyl-[acyl-carrier-protein] synthase II
MEAQTSWRIEVPSRLPIEEPSEEGQSRRRVVITGVGVVAPSGIGVEALWDLLIGGRSAVRPIEGFDVTEYPIRIAAQVPGFRARDFLPAVKARGLSRFAQLAAAASRLAVDDGHVPGRLLASSRAGLFIGTAAGAIAVGETQAATFAARGVRSVRPTFPACVSPHSAAIESAGEFQIAGPVATTCTDCPSGLDAIASAYRQIQAGALRAAVAGGADAPISPMLFGGFARSGMLADRNDTPALACRPLDASRSGFVLGEGAAMLLLEEESAARMRGARIYGEIAGVGVGHDRPTRLGQSDVSGHGFFEAAMQALTDAGVSARDLEHINAHAPGMTTTDLAEARGIQRLLGARRRIVPVTSIKGAVGHPLAAAGVLQIVTALLTMERGRIPHTVNCEVPDRACDLDVVAGAPRAATVRSTLVLSHGFGGNTTSIFLRKAADQLC